MIRIGGANVADIRVGNSPIREVRIGGELVWSRGVYVAGGLDGIFYSRDLVNWSESNIGDLCYFVTFVNGMFWACGKRFIANSSDGINWTKVLSVPIAEFPQPIFHSLSFGTGKYVSVGQQSNVDKADQGVIYISSDGLNWSRKKIATIDGEDCVINGVAFGNGVFVAGGSYGKIYYSTDASSWSEANCGVYEIKDIAFGNGEFVAIGNVGNTFHSQNGQAWVNSKFDVEINNNAVAFGNGRFVVGSESSYVRYSTDLVNWSKVKVTVGSSINNTVDCVEFLNGRFIARFYSSATGPRLCSSKDATHWTDIPGFDGTKMRSIAFGMPKQR